MNKTINEFSLISLSAYFWWIELKKHLFKIEIFCNIKNIFTVTFINLMHPRWITNITNIIFKTLNVNVVMRNIYIKLTDTVVSFARKGSFISQMEHTAWLCFWNFTMSRIYSHRKRNGTGAQRTWPVLLYRTKPVSTTYSSAMVDPSVLWEDITVRPPYPHFQIRLRLFFIYSGNGK